MENLEAYAPASRGPQMSLSGDEDPTVQKAKDLDNWAPLDTHRWSDYPQVNDAVNELFDTLSTSPKFKGKKNLRKKHIKVVVLDFYVKYLQDPRRWTGYYRMSSKYRPGGRYNKLHISRLTIDIVDALESLGYVEQYKGHYSRTGGSSHMSRVRAMPLLIDLLKHRHRVTLPMIGRAPNTECIVLRDYDAKRKKQVDIDYDDTPDTIRMRNELTRYNNSIRRTFIDIPHFPSAGVPSKSRQQLVTIEHSQKFTRRIFQNGTWDDGGRFYGPWWQTVPKEWRSRIRINNLPTIEIDYSGLHIVLLYAEKGIDYWDQDGEDPYKLPGVEESERMRILLKDILLAAVNAKDESAALKGVRKKINFNKEEYGWVGDERVDLKSLIRQFAQRHALIQDRFFSNAGIKLQNIDGKIAEQVINTLTDRDTPVLSIHDSFIVALPVEDKLRREMKESIDAVVFRELGISKITEKMKRDPKMPWHVLMTQHRTPFGDPEGFYSEYRELISPSDDKYKHRWEAHKNLKFDEDYYHQ